MFVWSRTDHPRYVAMYQTLPKLSRTPAERSSYGWSSGAPIELAPACRARSYRAGAVACPRMEPRTVARLHVLGRAVIGGGLVVAPRVFAGGWVGGAARKPGGQVLAAALGARDVAIALGALRSLRAGHGAGPWLRAGVLADLVDLVATLRARDSLPPLAGPGVAALAGGSVALGAWLQSAVD